MNYKYIRIEELKGRKFNDKPICVVINKKNKFLLGEIVYHKLCKQYFFCPYLHRIFSYDCLQDIAGFIQKLNELSKAGKDGAKAGKKLKDKISFEPNDPPRLDSCFFM